jgi:ribosome assembly protein 3
LLTFTVSSSSDTSSSSDSESEVEIKRRKKTKKEKKEKTDARKESSDEESISSDSEVDNSIFPSRYFIDHVQSPVRPEPEPKITFSAWYLRQVAKELEEDLDKVRSAGDFSNTSLPVLINALQQGASNFTDDEKRRILSAI